MNSNEKTLTFLLYGDVNTGKTSTIATLCETESSEISKTPGTTKEIIVHELKVGDKVLAKVVDSPGLVRPQKIVEWLYKEKDSPSDKPLTERFLAAADFTGDDFKHEQKLVEAIKEADFLLVMVPANQELLVHDEDLIKTSHYWGKPTGILLNKTEEDPDVRDEIIKKLRGLGTPFCQFDANTAGFSHRKMLIEYMYFMSKFMGEPNDPNSLRNLSKKIQNNWDWRRKNIAKDIIRKLTEAMTLSEKVSEVEGEEESAKENYSKSLKDCLMALFWGIQETYNHQTLKVEAGEITALSHETTKHWEFEWSFKSTARLFRKRHKKYGPISEQSNPRPYRFAKYFIAHAIACFRICAGHPHANIKKAKGGMKIEKPHKVAGLAGFRKSDALKSFCKKPKSEKEKNILLYEVEKALSKSLDVREEDVS